MTVKSDIDDFIARAPFKYTKAQLVNDVFETYPNTKTNSDFVYWLHNTWCTVGNPDPIDYAILTKKLYSVCIIDEKKKTELTAYITINTTSSLIPVYHKVMVCGTFVEIMSNISIMVESICKENNAEMNNVTINSHIGSHNEMLVEVNIFM